jgi:DNA-binding PadR family transcriptional regulator
MRERSIGRDAALIGRSPVQAAALAVLLEAPGYGWDVARRVNRRVGPSWRLSEKHIYPVLEKLEADGLVRSVEERFERKPYLRAVYHPTERAEQVRRGWLVTPLVRTAIRTDLQARLVFSTERDIPDLLRALEDCRMDILEEIEGNAASETPRVSYMGTTMSLYRSGVDKLLKAEMEWIEEAIRELQALLPVRSGR